MAPDVIENYVCLACGSIQLETVLDLGSQPLANSYLTEVKKEPSYPLTVKCCHECCHLQLTHTVNPELIYRNYLYTTGTSQTMKDYSDWYAGFVREYIPYARSVLDVGCNDGTQLDSFAVHDFETHGIDPAENLVSKIRKHSVVCDFFNEDSVKHFGSKTFDVISNQNAFSHLADPLGCLQTARKLLSDSGLIFISTSQADMVINGEFDTIYHEHISFYNSLSMSRLARRAGLFLVDVIKTPVHGNTYIFVLSKAEINKHRVHNILQMEKKNGLQDFETYRNWSASARRVATEFTRTCQTLRAEGTILVGYGAAAKGNTLLNFTGVILDAVVDDNPLKQGLLTPGMHIPIYSSAYLNELDPDAIVVIPLAWNFFEEIKAKVSNHTGKNFRYLSYFPEIKLHGR